MNIPTILTLFRLASIPIIVMLYYLPNHWGKIFAAILFFAAATTDWLDGHLARTWAQTTRLGAFLDPVADKLLVATSLIIIVGVQDLPYLVIPAAVIVAREIVISALREWMAEMGKRASIAVSFVGKVKTTVQMISLILLLSYYPGTFSWILWLGGVLLYIAALLTIWSMFIYLKLSWRDLTLSREK